MQKSHGMRSLSTMMLLLIIASTTTIIYANSKKKPNIILILADDLGYGDLGWAPFIGNEMSNVKTPNLRKMSENGMILTNFHTASPVCSPSRASIMVGLFPWRLGIDFIYAGDLKHDGSEEIDHEQLPLIPNLAMSLRENGYYTAHVGKWHLGGQSHLDIPRRAKSSVNDSEGYLNIGCIVPGILQYGFDEYIGMSEGTGSMRYKTHQAGNTYTQGYKYLIKNDHPLPIPEKPEILTDRQTNEALRVIREQYAADQPFFLNLWYDAPHSPWEGIEPYFEQYRNKFSTILLRKYASMITNMDENIGKILSLVEELKIDRETFIVFTSDNGPEFEAGSTGPFLGRKRLLTEGGIRVPAILQWKGRISPHSSTDKFVLTTDLFPTFLHAARVKMPSHIRIDGVSFMPILDGEQTPLVGDERTVLWYTHSPGYPKFTAAWSHGYKFIWNDYEGRTGAMLPPSKRLFFMKIDPTERNNLLPDIRNSACPRFSMNATTAQGLKLNETQWFHILQQPISATDPLFVLLVASHLSLKAHLFRYIGDTDWRVTHANQHFTMWPSCKKRTSGSDSLSWHNTFIAPEFCGDNLYAEQGGRPLVKSAKIQEPDGKVVTVKYVRRLTVGSSFSPTCKCGHSECSLLWRQGNKLKGRRITTYGWLFGAIGYGLSSLTVPNSGLEAHLKRIFELTSFTDICGGLSLFEAAGHSVSVSQTCNKDSLDTDSSQSAWAPGDLVPQVVGAEEGSDGDRILITRQCHQRLHSRGKNVLISGTGSCGDETQLVILNLPYMSHPLSLCPRSQDNYKSQSKMDDNVFMVYVNLYLRLRPFGDSSTISMDRLVQSSHLMRSVHIIDPLAFHVWWKSPLENRIVIIGEPDYQGSFCLINEFANYYRDKHSVNFPVINPSSNPRTGYLPYVTYWGFYKQTLLNLHSAESSSSVMRDKNLKLVLFPMLVGSGHWGVTIVITYRYPYEMKASNVSNSLFIVVNPTSSLSAASLFDTNLLESWIQHISANLRLSRRVSHDSIVRIDMEKLHNLRSFDSGIAIITFIREIVDVCRTNLNIRAPNLKEFAVLYEKVSQETNLNKIRSYMMTAVNILQSEHQESLEKYLIQMSKKKFNI